MSEVLVLVDHVDGAVRKPTYEELLETRMTEAVAKKGKGKIEDLFKAEDVWTVE